MDPGTGGLLVLRGEVALTVAKVEAAVGEAQPRSWWDSTGGAGGAGCGMGCPCGVCMLNTPGNCDLPANSLTQCVTHTSSDFL